MSMYPFGRRGYERSWDLAPWRISPMERYMRGFFDEAMREMERPFRDLAPYWLEQPMMRQADIGNVVGNVTDDKDKFAVEMDVSQFSPEELKVEVRDKELVVEGHHEERSDQYGTIERHFIRKYMLPEDADVQAVNSRLSDVGVLTVVAPKNTSALPPARTIPIQAAPKNTEAKKP
ncbi:Small heat shock protein OV25-1 [Toxocara canis]|nr:Small heat shock protein OV25-1 [Toxocara canis]